MPKATSSMTYEKAIARLESIVSNLERGDLELDNLASQLKEAKSLLAFCREKLSKVESDIQQIFQKEKTL